MPELVVVTADPTPPYEQLRRQLAGLIRSGVLPAGSRLPPLRQLAGDLGLAVGTVARTYRELETAGLIRSRRGGGTRVAEPPTGEAAESSTGVAPGDSASMAGSSAGVGPGARVAGSSAGVVPGGGARVAGSSAGVVPRGGVRVAGLPAVVVPGVGAWMADLPAGVVPEGGVRVAELPVGGVPGGGAWAAEPAAGVAPADAAAVLRGAAADYVRRARAVGADPAEITAAVREALDKID